MRSCLVSLVPLGLLASLGCESPPAAGKATTVVISGQPVSTSNHLRTPSGALPPGSLDAVIAPIDTTITLGAWMAAHSADSVSLALPDGALDDHICRTSSATVAVAGRPMRRIAAFGYADPPAGEALPASEHVAERICALQAVWLIAEENDSIRAHALADSVTGTLEAALAPSTPGSAMSGSGNGTWIDSRSWQAAAHRIVVGILPRALLVQQARTPADSAATTHRVIIVAFTRASRMYPDEYRREREHPELAEEVIERAHADTAALMLPAALGGTLRTLLALHPPEEPRVERTAGMDSAVVRAARAVRAAAPALDPARRAAALFALDVGVSRTLPDLPLRGDSGHGHDPLHPLLQDAGLHYHDASLDEISGYDRAPLHEAFAVDSSSRAGQFALLALLRSGWYGGPACGSGGAAFDTVIVHGEAALARGVTDPLVHFYVGSAWNDIVWLAHNGDDTYVDARQYLPREALARRRALEHLTAAHAGLRDTRLRRENWRLVTRLLLGRGSETRYFCVYD